MGATDSAYTEVFLLMPSSPRTKKNAGFCFGEIYDGEIDIVLLGADDFLKIANPTLLVSARILESLALVNYRQRVILGGPLGRRTIAYSYSLVLASFLPCESLVSQN